MTTTISREYWFSAAHRLEGHPKCGRLHGHNYRVVAVLKGETDKHGMIMDYGKMDEVIKPVIDGYFDHRYLVSNENLEARDKYAEMATERGEAADIFAPASTAECLAELLAGIFIKEGLPIASVTVDETPKSSATFVVME